MASNPGTTTYPGTVDDFANVGTTTYEDDTGYGHQLLHNQVHNAIEAIEAVCGTTAGTSVLKDVLAGQFVATTAGTETLTNKTIGDTLTMTTGAITQGGAAAHITLTPGTSKLVKTAVLQQDGTTNSYKNNSAILTGWSYVTGTTTTFSKAITFGNNFTAPPIVLVSSLGQVGTATTPDSIDDFNDVPGGDPLWGELVYSVGTTGFTAILLSATARSAAYHYGFSWIAIGAI